MADIVSFAALFRGRAREMERREGVSEKRKLWRRGVSAGKLCGKMH